MLKITPTVLILFLGILFGTIVKLFVIDVLHIAGVSMEPALKDGSVVAVNKLSYGLVKPSSGTFFFQWASPKIDDIVIYLHDNKIVVKRCVAVSGQELDFSDDSQYSVKVGEKIVPLTRMQYKNLSAFKTVPDGFIMALGDNTAQSVDSRDYGFVSVKNITGKIIGK